MPIAHCFSSTQTRTPPPKPYFDLGACTAKSVGTDMQRDFSAYRDFSTGKNQQGTLPCREFPVRYSLYAQT